LTPIAGNDVALDARQRRWWHARHCIGRASENG
jgi:hypothetical protein